MIALRQSMIARLAHSSLRLALRFWPEASRHWGHALAAELDEIENPLEALHWALGGLMLFARASASHFLAWLKLPAGSRFSPASVPPGIAAPILPKRPRLFTAAVLAATALLLFLSQSRQAISLVNASWHGYEISSADRRTLANLAVRAEKEKDARTLAFVALTLHPPEQAMLLADKAVALDPSLTWIYTSRFYRPDDVPQSTEWIARLHAFDPDNSFIDLFTADAMVQPRYAGLLAHGTPSPQQIESALASDPQWVAQMEAAFRAPRYDGYLRKNWELISSAWNRDPSLSPSIIGYGLWSHRIPNVLNLKTFVSLKVHRAQQARTDGHAEQAEKILAQIDSFGNRMQEQSQTDLERIVGLDLERLAAQEFRTLYTETGQEVKAQGASARVQQLRELQQSFSNLSMAVYLTEREKLPGYAFLFQITTVLVFLSALAVALSFFLLELRPRSSARRRPGWQRMLCRTADYAPASLLFVCAAFLLSFLPFARQFAGYRGEQGTATTLQSLSSTLWELEQFPSLVRNLFQYSSFWWFFTFALVALAIFILVRGFYRAAPTAPSPS
jgi:hypothetical protein